MNENKSGDEAVQLRNVGTYLPVCPSRQLLWKPNRRNDEHGEVKEGKEIRFHCMVDVALGAFPLTPFGSGWFVSVTCYEPLSTATTSVPAQLGFQW